MLGATPQDRLHRALHPRGIAVVGASRDPTKRGHQVVRALLGRGYAGGIYPVNPSAPEILGLRVAASIGELPDAVDLAVVCTPAATVPALVEALGGRGVAGAVVLAAGFRESGDEGAALQRRLREVALRTGVRVIGPNTSGILNLDVGLDLIGVPGCRPGRLALLAQSGNAALGLLNEAADQPGQGFSAVVGLGNEVDVRFHECLDLLGRDPANGAILIHAESLADGRTFLEVARKLSPHRPIVLLKGGRSGSGARAAFSHTGAVATDQAALRAGLRQAGIVEVTRSDDLLSVGRTLESQPAAAGGSGLAVLADGGGYGALAADHLEELGVPLAPLGDRTCARLRRVVGHPAEVGNPVDLAGAADRDPGAFAQALSILAEDAAVSGILVVSLLGGYSLRFAAALEEPEHRAAEAMASAAREAQKPVVVHSVYGGADTPALRALRERGVPVLRSVETACRAAAACWQRGRLLEGVRRGRGGAGPGAVAPSPHLRSARREGREVLLEPEVRALLGRYGVPLVPARICRSPDEAAAAVRELGRPAALKAISGTVSHKSEAGGVALGVEGAEGAARAFGRIRRSLEDHARARGIGPDLRGVLVSPMLGPPAVELLAGVRRDPSLGPVLCLGAGGTAVEVLKDVAVRVLPVDPEELTAMVDELRIAPILRGHRGRPGVDLPSLERLLLGLARCAEEHPDLLELEVNPIFAGPEGVRAVDARGFLAPAAVPAAAD